MALCWVCSSENIEVSRDTLDGHTVLESEERCWDCGHRTAFSYGFSTELIGRWAAEWHHTETNEECFVRRCAAHVARMIRRHEFLSLTPPAELGFVAALVADPGDFTAAKVYADWCDEHGKEWDAIYLRGHSDASGFAWKGESVTAETT